MAERSDKKAETAFFHPDLLEIPETRTSLSKRL